jgi:hypothetical protein
MQRRYLALQLIGFAEQHHVVIGLHVRVGKCLPLPCQPSLGLGYLGIEGSVCYHGDAF